jgi:4-diphosphocytidyl-2-C-methyl-D-erythritol kinase
MRAPVTAVTARAPAKLNLHLCVGQLRPDGYHDLTTVFQAVSLYDEVTVRRADTFSIVVQGDTAAGVPTDASNLAGRAVRLLAQEAGVAPDVAVLLHKAIPVAGGCAGGSADAAAALVACDELWDLGLDRSELAQVGAQLGSDVPFALHGGTALGRGRGEQLTPVLGAGTYTWLLAVADGGLSTPEVYRELDRQRETGLPSLVSDPANLLSALRTGSAAAVGKALDNDLQDAALALRPQLARLLEEGLARGALGGLVSGSGPTAAFLVPDEERGAALGARLEAEGLCRTTRLASGPVPGARVVRSA